MDLNTYQKGAKTTANYPSSEYPFVCLVEEADEIKTASIRFEMTGFEEHRQSFLKELGDECWEVAMACHEINVEMNDLNKFLDDYRLGSYSTMDMAIGTIYSVVAKTMRKRNMNFEDVICASSDGWLHENQEEADFFEEKHVIIVQQLGAILNSLKAMAESVGSSLEEVMQMNLDKLQGRKQRGTICGAGDER